MKKRVFIALPLPEELRQNIEKSLDEIADTIPEQMRIARRENWHITLIFLGDRDDEEIGHVLRALENVAHETDILEITLHNIMFGPARMTENGLESITRPRMVWLTGTQESSHKVGALRDAVEEQILKENVHVKQENRQFTTHITLARARGGVAVSKQFSYPFPKSFIAERIELIESTLTPKGPYYDTLTSFDFNGEIK
jgi:RNA 2',3'-cyclic 3'-phosphodiesterase